MTPAAYATGQQLPTPAAALGAPLGLAVFAAELRHAIDTRIEELERDIGYLQRICLAHAPDRPLPARPLRSSPIPEVPDA